MRSDAVWVGVRRAGLAFLMLGNAAADEAASAAEVKGRPAPVQLAQAGGYAIPPGPLAGALERFAIATGLQVLYDSQLTAGRISPGVSGTLAPQAALARLLAGTGVIGRIEGNKVLLAPNSHAPASAVDPNAMTLPPVQVEASAGGPSAAQIGNLPAPYAGGLVARGGRLGILGNRDFMDTPFSQTNYTSQLIEDQQARFLTDVLRNDPSIQLFQTAATGFTNFAIRGIRSVNSDILFNGYAITPAPNGSLMTEGIERVEVLRGPNALLNGSAPEGSIGGMVNLVPKRAGDEPLARFTSGYISDSQFGGHGDIGWRFGPNKEIGVRVNGAYRSGDLPIDHSPRESGLGTVALDYRGDAVRLAADFGYQQQETRGMRRPFSVASGLTVLPAPPNTRTNANQPWELNNMRAPYGTLRGEVDVTKHVTAFAGFGGIQNRRRSINGNRQITDSLGTLAASADTIGLTAIEEQIVSFDAGVRGSFDTGPIRHQVVAAYSRYSREGQQAFNSTGVPLSNIYNPVFAPAPRSSLLPGYDAMKKRSETSLSSAMLGDTLSIVDERVQLTGGVRFQQIKATNFDITTGAVTNRFDKSVPTPMVGLVVKPWQNLSLYGNYIEGLQQGPTAPTTAANAGQIFPPFVSNGYEAGVKADLGHVATTLAAFQITQPSAFVDPATNIFGVDGEQRNRGLELSVFGEVTDGLRLIAGAAYIDAVLTKTQGRVNQGNKAPVAPFQLVLYGEWDLPFVKGLTLNSRVTQASSQYVNLANTQRVPGWVQWDIGASYRLDLSNGTPITIRATIDNVLDNNAWYGSSLAGQVIVRDPRTFLLSMTFDL